ncbi:MAG: flagellar biosynthesis protein FlhA [Fusobacterium sp.]|nr:flagellar biosynthesis protein FlhA [Fusobacterium sp.]
MFKNKKMQYVIKTCSSEDTQALQNLLNEMSMNGWELYTINEVELDEDYQYNCIFMKEAEDENYSKNTDEINISNFKSQMEKLLSPTLTPYEACLEIQHKIKEVKGKITRAKKELENEVPASIGRKRLNDKISSGLKELEELKRQLAETTSPDGMYKKLREDKLAISLSEEILGYIDAEQDIDEEELVAETVKLRLKLTEELGYVIPKIIFKDDETLNPYEYTIKIRGMEVFRGLVYPNHLMFFTDNLLTNKKIKDAIYDTDAISGKKIVWIDKEKCKDFWEKGLSGAQCITRALEFIAVKFVDEILDYNELDNYIEVVDENNSYLIENLIPEFLTLADLRYILTSLINERVSIKDITFILEKINDFANDADKSDILRKLRLSIGRQISKNHVNEDGVIAAIEITEDSLLNVCETAIDEDEDEEIIKIDAKYADQLAKKIEKLMDKYDCRTIIVPLEFRHLIFKMLSSYFNEVSVLSREEVSFYAPIEIYEEL